MSHRTRAGPCLRDCTDRAAVGHSTIFYVSRVQLFLGGVIHSIPLYIYTTVLLYNMPQLDIISMGRKHEPPAYGTVGTHYSSGP